jgi:hypothetical protein
MKSGHTLVFDRKAEAIYRKKLKPNGRNGTLTTKLPEFFEIVAQNGAKELLKKIFDGFLVGFRVVESESFSNRVVNEVGILLNQIVPGSFIAEDAAGKEGFLFFGHATCGSRPSVAPL